MRKFFVVTCLCACIPCIPCACVPDPPPAPEETPLVPLPALERAPTTLLQTLVPVNAPIDSDDNPGFPENVEQYIASGLGDVEVGPGEDVTVRTIEDGAPPPAGPNARRLARFVHLADIQLLDDESPTRAANFDSHDVESALRPQDPFVCRMLNAAVRTINALHNEDPISFVLLGGDNADSAQTNEVRWVMDILNGSASVHCDSGNDDDMDPKDDADAKDPFAAAGLDMPWYWISGNHDVLVQGNFTVDDEQLALSIGSEARLGTRDYTVGGFGIVAAGEGFIADAQRAVLDGPALIALVGDDEDGHGLKDVDRERGKAFYAFDEGELTFVVVDTSHERGGSGGVLKQSDVDTYVVPLLDDALARGRIVILASHHSIGSLSADGGTFGVEEPDAIFPDDWRAILGGYPNVLFAMTAHSHTHRVRVQQTPGHAFWEVQTSALIDYPHQVRVVEIYDDDNGTLRLETSVFDFFADDDPTAALGRSLGLIDVLSGWQGAGTGNVDERNVALIINKPTL